MEPKPGEWLIECGFHWKACLSVSSYFHPHECVLLKNKSRNKRSPRVTVVVAMKKLWILTGQRKTHCRHVDQIEEFTQSLPYDALKFPSGSLDGFKCTFITLLFENSHTTHKNLMRNTLLQGLQTTMYK